MPFSEQQDAGAHGLLPGQFQFGTTHWSVVVAAGHANHDGLSTAALETLCRTYWLPVYGFIRRSTSNPEEAQDLTQGFFEHLLQHHTLTRANPERGRFRSFLLGAVKFFLANERDRQNALKRGGHIEFLHFDTVIAEMRSAGGSTGSIESQFDRDWALSVLDRALLRLREEFELSGRAALFNGLKPFLTGEKVAETYLQVAERLNITEGAAKMTVTRMRDRFGAIVRQEIAQTVSTREDLDAELRAFVDALSS